MCGILAIIDPRGLHAERAKKALSWIKDRGPDAHFVMESGTSYFAQSVLSFTREDNAAISREEFFKNKDVFLFNGEIYNFQKLSKEYKIASSSDTLLLRKSLEKNIFAELRESLNGMFSTFYLSGNEFSFEVDPTGQKRLFYYCKNGLLVVSSTIRAINEYLDSRTLNRPVFELYFHTRHLLQGPETVFSDILVTLPGEQISGYLCEGYARIRSKSKRLIFPLNRRDQKVGEEAFALASEAIAPECDYVSIASGGIDSSLASAFLCRSSRPPCFTLGLSIQGKDELTKAYSFTTEVPHRVIDVSIELFAEKLEQTYQALNHPLPTHSFATQLLISSYLRSEKIRCVIGGDGGDELFGGYEAYKSLSYDNDSEYSISPYTNVQPTHTTNISELEIFKNLKSLWDHATTINCDRFETKTIANRQSVLDLDTAVQLSSVGLYSADIMNQAEGIEGRNFFLDNNILDLAGSTHPFEKISLGDPTIETRSLLKKLYWQIFRKMPAEKQGFSGFPNEAANLLLRHAPPTAILDALKLPIDLYRLKIDRTYEWKVQNIELFLRSCM